MSHATQLHNRRSLNDSLEILNRPGLSGNGTRTVDYEIQRAVIPTIKSALEHSLTEECRQYLGFVRYERVLWGRCPEVTRSGTYTRTLRTQYGGMTDFRLPKVRRGTRALPWQIIARDW